MRRNGLTDITVGCVVERLGHRAVAVVRSEPQLRAGAWHVVLELQDGKLTIWPLTLLNVVTPE